MPKNRISGEKFTEAPPAYSEVQVIAEGDLMIDQLFNLIYTLEKIRKILRKAIIRLDGTYPNLIARGQAIIEEIDEFAKLIIKGFEKIE